MKVLISIIIFAWCSLVIAQNKQSYLSSYDKYWELSDGFYRVMESGKVGLIDSVGAIIIPTEYNQVWNLQSNGNVKVLKDGKLGIYNVSGSIVVPTEYEMIWGFKDGKARVLRNGKIGYVNESGNEFIPCAYDQIWEFEEGRAKVLKNGKVGFVNSQGTEIIPAEYHTIWDFNDGRAKVLKDGKIGMIDMDGFEVIPCNFQQIYDFNEGQAKAVLNNEIVYIDTNGNLIDKGDVKTTSITVVNTDAGAGKDVKSVEIHLSEGDTTIVTLFGNQMVVVEDGDKTEISIGKNKYNEHKKDKSNRKFKGHYWGLDLGLNSYLNENGEMSLPDGYEFLDLNSAKSTEVSINFLQGNIPLSRRGNIGFVTGLGLTYNNYRYANATIPIYEDGMLTSEPIEGNLNKNKLTTLYLTAPFLLEYQFSRKSRNDFYLSAGPIGGYRLRSHTKVVTMEGGSKQKDKNRSSFGLEDFRYGAQVRFGYRFLNLYATYWMSPMFDINKGPELYPISVGFAFYPGRW
ncbi:WG repeat-containing protein [Saccharicrinis aurantiacus]|uniref:WG repeat-containing protein n=1 Tax=Saccharicrinis aurantiacus TaxID=1849719 RepID=UPI00083804E7|nr:WG repeat-containing protein [Saccharicrinis aurantiacus]